MKEVVNGVAEIEERVEAETGWMKDAVDGGAAGAVDEAEGTPIP